MTKPKYKVAVGIAEHDYSGITKDGESLSWFQVEQTLEENVVLIEAAYDLMAAIERSYFDISPCRTCGMSVVCLPDGLPCCDACGKKGESDG